MNNWKKQQQNIRRKSQQEFDQATFRHHHQITFIITYSMPPSNRTLAHSETNESILLAEEELQQIQIRQKQQQLTK